MRNDQIFQKYIRRLFFFLLEPLGFIEAEANEVSSSYGLVIRYVLNTLFIQICVQSRGSEFEVSVEFGRTKKDCIEEKYSFHMYLGVVNKPLYYELGYSIAKSNDEVVELLEIYANALKVNGEKILNNNDEAFVKIKEAMRTGKGLCRPYYQQPKTNKIISKFV